MKCICPNPRTILNCLLVVLGVTLSAFLFHQALLPCLGFIIPALVPTLYDLAVYGAYPTVDYVTSDLEGPSPNIIAWNDLCDDGLVLLSPFGASVPDAGPMILDSRGHPVWLATGFNTVMNLKVQRYLNENYLTFWAGEKVGGIGMGNYYMLNSSYDIAHIVGAVSSEHAPRVGDLHEFVITEDGTALMTVYNTTTFDVSAMGRPKDGWIVDSLFQEVDIATGELLFEWRASDHFNPSESNYLNPFGGYKVSNPYDFFHINSVQKDSKGNYLISSRHYHALIYLDSKGQVLWTLGGQYNEFEDLSNGKATSFKWQHDARWVDAERGILSVFDNGSAGPIMTDASQSLGLVIQIDAEKKTAKLLHAYPGKQGVLSASQGSVQILPNNHILVGWGSSAAYSEYTFDGELLCETHITPSSLFWWERVKTYRSLKTFDWVGQPEYPPVARLFEGKVWVSWNGATEVRAWQLEGRKAGAVDTDWQTVDIKDKTGFEDAFSLPTEEFAVYRIAALDREGRFIRHSNIADKVESKGSTVRWVLFGVFLVVGAFLGVWLFTKSSANFAWLKTKGLIWDRQGYKKVSGIEMN